jgi:hypothetical protein
MLLLLCRRRSPRSGLSAGSSSRGGRAAVSSAGRCSPRQALGAPGSGTGHGGRPRRPGWALCTWRQWGLAKFPQVGGRDARAPTRPRAHAPTRPRAHAPTQRPTRNQRACSAAIPGRSEYLMACFQDCTKFIGLSWPILRCAGVVSRNALLKATQSLSFSACVCHH